VSPADADDRLVAVDQGNSAAGSESLMHPVVRWISATLSPDRMQC
jgi:hypothetical protein